MQSPIILITIFELPYNYYFRVNFFIYFWALAFANIARYSRVGKERTSAARPVRGAVGTLTDCKNRKIYSFWREIC